MAPETLGLVHRSILLVRLQSELSTRELARWLETVWGTASQRLRLFQSETLDKLHCRPKSPVVIPAELLQRFRPNSRHRPRRDFVESCTARNLLSSYHRLGHQRQWHEDTGIRRLLLPEEEESSQTLTEWLHDLVAKRQYVHVRPSTKKPVAAMVAVNVETS